MSVTKRITDFFEKAEDGEFAFASNLSLLTRINAAHPIVYSTKPSIISACLAGTGVQPFTILGGYGLPSEEQLEPLRMQSGTNKMRFVGDADPPDLLIFRWLQAFFGDRIAYCGLNDDFLELPCLKTLEINTLPLSPAEVRAMRVLKSLFPSHSDVLGKRLSQLLHEGKKIELDVIQHSAREAAALFEASCKSDRDDCVGH